MPPYRALVWVASAAGCSLFIRSALVQPIPLRYSCMAFASYIGIVVTGAMLPHLQLFAEVFFRSSDGGTREIALTFDDGPDPQSTLQVLDILEGAQALATFFVVGAKAERYPEVVREIARRGHQVALHGYTHDRALGLRTYATIRRDLDRAVALHERLLGEKPRYYRPAIGQTNPRIARASADLGLRLVGWSIRARDGVSVDPSRVVSRIARRLQGGAIVLLHDAAELGTHTPAAIAALPTILDAIRARGLHPVRIDRLDAP